ncbi:MAG TPA: MBL fold metallo-hydrolase [Armatimonadetes bacterium]|nr:MBL fold metallo-hydrolase [Armatimonadota bacterium]
MRLHFLGAAGNVTGSCYLLELEHQRVLVDCGLYQERPLRGRNWEPFPFPAEQINVLLLTHAHIDHCGLIPKLCREGFQGRILTTKATVELAELLLLDAAHIQEEDARFKMKRHAREGRPDVIHPLYTTADAQAALQYLEGVPYGEMVTLGDGITVTFYDAGHILGSTQVEIRYPLNGQERVLLFSGDLGAVDRPILRDPAPPGRADYLVMESTYGDRQHESAEDCLDRLAALVNETFAHGGNLVIPAFAVGRTQELLYDLNELLAQDRIPNALVFVDSPMAVSATEIFQRHPECYDEEARQLLHSGDNPLEFPSLHLVRRVEDSKAINHLRGSAIIISASGMCTAGRIKHHLVHNISRPECTILFVGYQARGTLGRHLLEGENPVRILGQYREVKARIESLSGFSAHADQRGLLEWLGHLPTPPRQVFLTHGEPEALQTLQEKIREQLGFAVQVPQYRDVVELT